MATNSERIDELTRLIASHEQRIEQLERQLDRMAEAQDRDRQAGEATSKTVAVLADRSDVRAKSLEAWLNRLWTLLMVLAAGVVGYYLRR